MAFENIIQLTNHFANEQVCREHLANLRWGQGPAACPFCSRVGAYKIEAGKRFKCCDKECGKKFSVTVGTVFENTKLPLRVWFIGIYLACNHPKGISSVQLAKDLGITQKSAWFVLSRVREMLKEGAPVMLTGEVECDETYVGGKEGNKHVNKRGLVEKTPVFGLVQRGGRVVAKSVLNSQKATIQPIMRKHVAIGTKLYTDEHRGYLGLNKSYDHQTVVHSAGNYVNGAAHTNTIEGFWSLVKRRMVGVHHYVSPKHLDRYLDQACFQYNSRDLSQQDRHITAVRQAEGKRLTYRRLIGK